MTNSVYKKTTHNANIPVRINYQYSALICQGWVRSLHSGEGHEVKVMMDSEADVIVHTVLCLVVLLTSSLEKIV